MLRTVCIMIVRVQRQKRSRLASHPHAPGHYSNRILCPICPRATPMGAQESGRRTVSCDEVLGEGSAIRGHSRQIGGIDHDVLVRPILLSRDGSRSAGQGEGREVGVVVVAALSRALPCPGSEGRQRAVGTRAHQSRSWLFAEPPQWSLVVRRGGETNNTASDLCRDVGVTNKGDL